MQDKTYDGTTTATVESVTFDNLVNGESLSLGTDYTATAAFNSANAGSQTATVTVTLTDTVKNYTLASDGNTATATGTISPLPVVLNWETTSFTYDGSAKTVTAKVSNAVDGDTFTLTYEDNTGTAVGNYTAKVTDLGNDNYTLTGATGVELTWSIGGASIAGAAVDLSETEFTYTGQSQKPTVTVKLNGNTLNANTDYTVDFGGDSINAGTYTVTVTGTGNYSGTATSQPTYTITKADQAALSITSSGPATFGQNYTLTTSGGSGSGAVTITVSNGTGAATVNGNILTPSKAGTVTVTAVKAGDNNYNDGTSVSVTITINKGTYDGTKTAAGSVLVNWPGEVTLPAIPDGASYGTASYSGSDLTGLTVSGGKLSYTGGENIAEGQEYTVTVPVTGATNYENYNITVTLTGTTKKVPTGVPTLSTTTITYGQSLSTITLSGSMQDGGKPVTGTFAWADPDAAPNAGSYEAPWTFTPDNGDLYVPVSGTVTITVNKATPTGTPKYTAITTSGKTLADANLTTEGGTFSVPGTVTWELADTTQVQANTAYTWKFTPTDSSNYNTLTGSIELWHQSSSSGGASSGGGSSSGSKTETTTNPDGSTTTTVTKPDGTVTTTTTDPAGNKTEVVANPDGTSKTTIENKDGSGSVTVVDENGNVVSSATLSQAAVEAAQEKGEAVALPIPEVPAATDRESAPTVTVDLPVGGSVKVEIPVEDVTAGTVAVIVKANGTKEVIKTSLTTETGVAVTLSDGDTVKVVDNSKTFDDVADNYWGAEAVDFAVSRELFAGTSATTFAPDTAMTRAMIVTVLARFEGVDTTTGSTWYEAGQQWAMENGVSDGTNMDASLTREQLATMLYRYAQSKGYDTTQGGMAVREYADFEQISDYAVEAMTWAVNTGLISGTSTTTLSPQGEATRAQVATILMWFIEGNQ